MWSLNSASFVLHKDSKGKHRAQVKDDWLVSATGDAPEWSADILTTPYTTECERENSPCCITELHKWHKWICSSRNGFCIVLSCFSILEFVSLYVETFTGHNWLDRYCWFFPSWFSSVNMNIFVSFNCEGCSDIGVWFQTASNWASIISSSPGCKKCRKPSLEPTPGLYLCRSIVVKRGSLQGDKNTFICTCLWHIRLNKVIKVTDIHMACDETWLVLHLLDWWLSRHLFCYTEPHPNGLTELETRSSALSSAPIVIFLPY